MLDIFNVNSIFFTVLDYPMSYLEFFGTIFYALSIILIWKRKSINWPIGLIGVGLFMILFYQIQLYSDFIEQIYYVITGFWGWWLWTKGSKDGDEDSNEIKVKLNSPKNNLILLISVIAGTAVMTVVMANVHNILPSVFPTAADYPFLDAFTTVLSFAAQILLSYKLIENWYLWIVVDVIAVGLYYVKDVKFLSLLYACFLIMAINGWWQWRKQLLTQTKGDKNENRSSHRQILPTA